MVAVSFVSLSLVVTPILATADSANWSPEKAAAVDVNRNSDAGIGNGGERNHYRKGWIPTRWGEDGPADRDPGNSAGNNNACHEPGKYRDTSC